MSPQIELPPRELHLWFLDLNQAAVDRLSDQYLALLDVEELERYERFRFERDRRTYAAAHALLRTTLSHYLAIAPEAWHFKAGAHGRPEICEPHHHGGLRFNLSHTRGAALVGVIRTVDVGVDLETLDRSNDCDALAERYFSPAEVRSYQALPEAQRRAAFFEYWTLKEAYVKACGLGLSVPLDQFSFDLRERPIPIKFEARLRDDPHGWRFGIWRPGSSLQAAYAVRSGTDVRAYFRRAIPLNSAEAATELPASAELHRDE